MIQIEQTITSVEVAEMVNKRHTDLIRDIRRYSEQLAESKIALSDFFTESTYKDSTGRALPCYNVTKKGCEFIANKLTGDKGILFTAKFINIFTSSFFSRLPITLCASNTNTILQALKTP